MCKVDCEYDRLAHEQRAAQRWNCTLVNRVLIIIHIAVAFRGQLLFNQLSSTNQIHQEVSKTTEWDISYPIVACVCCFFQYLAFCVSYFIIFCIQFFISLLIAAFFIALNVITQPLFLLRIKRHSTFTMVSLRLLFYSKYTMRMIEALYCEIRKGRKVLCSEQRCSK